MLQKYVESDFELSFLETSRIGFLRKNLNTYNLFGCNKVMVTSFFFFFSNIVDIDMFLIHRFLLVFWLFSGEIGSIMNLKISLRLGIYYHHFILNYTMKWRKFLYVLSFVLDDFLDERSDFKIHDNNYVLCLKGLDLFTNYKLARGVYFHRVQEKFYLRVVLLNLSSNFFKVFLSSLKLDVV